MNEIGELIELANAVSNEHAQFDEYRGPLNALETAATEVGRAWSGSNIGYHAYVYYAGFQPAPPGSFSAEWGLLDRWPTHQPDRNWGIFDADVVRAEVIRRAAEFDPRLVEERLAPMRRVFQVQKENLVSILSTATAKTKDAFLQTQLARVEELDSLTPGVVARHMLPSGQVWSRDSRAMSEGLQIAPHEVVLSVPVSARMLDDNFTRLEEVARLAARHIQRLNPEGRGGVQVGGAVTFIGHGRSLVWRELKDFLKDRLGLVATEFNGVSAAGIPTVERLQDMLNSAAFAFIVMTGEDEQADGQLHARQNVIHEAGLFQGRLGFGKAIILLEEGCADFSNIHGLGVIPFAKGKISSCFEDVRKVLEREKIMAEKA